MGKKQITFLSQNEVNGKIKSPKKIKTYNTKKIKEEKWL